MSPRNGLRSRDFDEVTIIYKNLIIAQSHQKSYIENKRRALEFAIGDHVFLKIFPYEGKMQYGKREKLSPHFVRPFEILECVGPMAYCIALPPKFSYLHDVFHVSIFRRYHHDSSHIIPHQ